MEKETLGKYLSRERIMREISLEDISRETRIPLVMLRALEEENFTRLPAHFYVQGFLRSYSNYVGLDANEVLLRYEEALTRHGGKKKKRSFAMWNIQPLEIKISLIVVGVIIAALIAFSLFTQREKKIKSQTKGKIIELDEKNLSK